MSVCLGVRVTVSLRVTVALISSRLRRLTPWQHVAKVIHKAVQRMAGVYAALIMHSAVPYVGDVLRASGRHVAELPV